MAVAVALANGAVTEAKLGTDTVTGPKVHLNVVGSGLTQGVRVEINVSTDNATTEVSPGNIQIKDSGVDTTQIAEGR